jgi:predicted ATPase/DNA-binding CsgD family transcriptional regulator
MNGSNHPFLLSPLTERELDILKLIVEGLSNPEIADHLVIGVETVRWHIKQLYSKLDVHSRTQAVHRANELGLLTNPKTLVGSLEPVPQQDNLPIYNLPFVGRETEATELNTLLQDPDVRLITIVGPGGMGKTRLCVEVARQQKDNFRDGICFVPLLTIQSANEIELAFANGLDLRLHNDHNTRSELLEYLQSKVMLILLDSFPHTLVDVELVISILKRARKVKIMVTSHTSLNLREEWVRHLAPLDIPTTTRDIENDNLETYGAIKLFDTCVRRIRGDFSLKDHLPAVIQICRTVQGMPLAIELAAAWLKTLSVEDVASEIQRNIDFLTTTQRDFEVRHRSIQAVFEHSWNQLTDEEQRVFQRLSVFRGRFGFPAAEQVGGASIQVLSELVGKSLLQQHSTGLYEIHSLLREYAERKLESQDINLLSARSSKLQMWAAFIKGKFDGVEQSAKIALKYATDYNQTSEKAFIFSLLGILAGTETDYEQCRQLSEAAQALNQDDVMTAVVSHLSLSISCCGFDDYGGAKHYIRIALKRAITLHMPTFSLLCLPVMAIVLATDGKLETAVEIMALAFTYPDNTLDWIKRWSLIRQLETDLEAELGSEGYKAAWERGKVLNTETIVEYLLTQL